MNYNKKNDQLKELIARLNNKQSLFKDSYKLKKLNIGHSTIKNDLYG